MKWSIVAVAAALGVAMIGAAAAPTAAPPATPGPVAGAPGAPAAAGRGPAAPADPTANTTGPLTRPIVASIGTGVWYINEFGADTIYLVVGETRALVIDTGSGFIDLKALVEGLTRLPYDVAITHAHPDHAGGIEQFDAVYANPADFQQALGITYQTRVNYGRTMRANNTGIPNIWGYSDATVKQWDKKPEMKAMPDGHVFDLGGRKVTAYNIPNHTPGSTIFIDDKSRIAFTGDAINGNVQVAQNGSVANALRGFLRVKALGTGYDRIFTGHIAYATNMATIQPQPIQTLDDLIENARRILRGTATVQQLGNNLNPAAVRPTAVFGAARTAFNPERLWEPGEPQVVP